MPRTKRRGVAVDAPPAEIRSQGRVHPFIIPFSRDFFTNSKGLIDAIQKLKNLLLEKSHLNTIRLTF